MSELCPGATSSQKTDFGRKAARKDEKRGAKNSKGVTAMNLTNIRCDDQEKNAKTNTGCIFKAKSALRKWGNTSARRAAPCSEGELLTVGSSSDSEGLKKRDPKGERGLTPVGAQNHAVGMSATFNLKR